MSKIGADYDFLRALEIRRNGGGMPAAMADRLATAIPAGGSGRKQRLSARQARNASKPKKGGGNK